MTVVDMKPQRVPFSTLKTLSMPACPGYDSYACRILSLIKYWPSVPSQLLMLPGSISNASASGVSVRRFSSVISRGFQNAIHPRCSYNRSAMSRAVRKLAALLCRLARRPFRLRICRRCFRCAAVRADGNSDGLGCFLFAGEGRCTRIPNCVHAAPPKFVVRRAYLYFVLPQLCDDSFDFLAVNFGDDFLANLEWVLHEPRI